MNDGLKDIYRQAIIDILSANPRVEGVVLFGSRAMETFTPTSDVDIALFGEELTLGDQAKLAASIDDLSMPQRADLLLHHRIKSEELLDHIKRHGVEWYCTSFKNGRISATEGEWYKSTLPISFPKRGEQQAIACILGALDDKIELNRRMSQSLEEIARTIFKSWFFDFDPVHVKAAGQQPPGLKLEIGAFFPDSFEDSKSGEIPKGWRTRSLSEILHVNPTRSLVKGTLASYLDMASMPTQGPFPENWTMREVGSGMKFINGDTLVARITPCLENGKTAFVDFLAGNEVGWGSTEYIVLRPKGAIPPIFAYLLARTEDFRSFAIHQMTESSGRQRVPADSLNKYDIPSPEIDSPLFQYFGELVTPFFDRIKEAMKQSHTLATLRDVLLSRLISGDLRVKDAERIIGRMV